MQCIGDYNVFLTYGTMYYRVEYNLEKMNDSIAIDR